MPESPAPEFVELPVTDPIAAALLDEYFTSRELGFIAPDNRTYRRATPDPAAFDRPHGVFVVVRDPADGANVGCGGIKLLAPDRAELKHVWLEPHVRGRGWGRALIAKLEDLARELGATEAVLDTNDSLETAGHIYRTSGYADIAPYNDNPNANVWLRRDLA